MNGLTIRGWVYSILVVVAPFAALGWGDPSPALVAIPAALLLVYGLAARSQELPRVRAVLGTDRTLEGAPVDLRLTVTGSGSFAHLSVDLPPHLELVESEGALRVEKAGLVIPMADGVGEAKVTVVAHRWGNHPLGGATVTVPGPAGMTAAQAVVAARADLVVLPETETVRRLVEPYATNLHAGDIASRARGPGSDLAELRPWLEGDSPRSINWRASARSDQVWVTERYTDRNGDLILVIDSVVARGSGMEEAVAAAVRVAGSLVKSYGAVRHRLGLVSLSGFSRWFGLDSGMLHEHRLLAAAMATQTLTEPVWSAVDRVLDRTVRPPSMVVFVSPLLDDALLERVLRLGRAGIDVMTLAVDVSPWLAPPLDRTQRVARRLFALEREETMDRLRGAGVAVGEWEPGRSLDQVLEEVELWRRQARRARV